MTTAVEYLEQQNDDGSFSYYSSVTATTSFIRGTIRSPISAWYRARRIWRETAHEVWYTKNPDLRKEHILYKLTEQDMKDFMWAKLAAEDLLGWT